MATYSTAAFTAEEVNQLPTCDNLFCYEARRKVKYYSAHSYSGTSNGLFIHQGGLLPTFCKLVTSQVIKRHVSHAIIRPGYIPRAGRALLMHCSSLHCDVVPLSLVQLGERVALCILYR